MHQKDPTSRNWVPVKGWFYKKIKLIFFTSIWCFFLPKTTNRVAHKIYEISLTTQVISITHLPQVAALSKNHVKISKDIKNNRTYTSIKYLNLEEKSTKSLP